MTKYCKDCANAYTAAAKNPEAYMCNRSLGANPVDGSPMIANWKCIDDRMGRIVIGHHSQCGEEGIHFIQKAAK